MHYRCCHYDGLFESLAEHCFAYVPEFLLRSQRLLNITFWWGNLLETPLGRLRRRWEDNMKMNLSEISFEDGLWFKLAQDHVLL
jgi:hypothetical protein